MSSYEAQIGNLGGQGFHAGEEWRVAGEGKTTYGVCALVAFFSLHVFKSRCVFRLLIPPVPTTVDGITTIATLIKLEDSFVPYKKPLSSASKI
jgi:hypothetical protein